MAITSYSTLKAEIPNYINEGLNGTDVDTFIDLAEDRINRDLRVLDMETAFSDTISSGVIALPSGFRELKNAYVDGSPTVQLQQVGLDWLYANYPLRSSDSKPKFIAVEDGNFAFGPYPDSGYTIKGVYYQTFTALSTSNETNFLTDSARALLLYACLTHACEFTRDDEASARWGQMYERELARVQGEDVRKRRGWGSPIRRHVA